MSCDHTIGYLNNFVRQSDAVEILTRETCGWNDHNRILSDLYQDKKGKYKITYKPADFLDRRRGMMTVFNHCPYCGEKVDWKSIKAKLSKDE